METTRMPRDEMAEKIAVRAQPRKGASTAGQRKLERLHDDEDDDQDHQRGRQLIHHAPVPSSLPWTVGCKRSNCPAEDHMHHCQHDHKCDLCMQPSALKLKR